MTLTKKQMEKLMRLCKDLNVDPSNIDPKLTYRENFQEIRKLAGLPPEEKDEELVALLQSGYSYDRAMVELKRYKLLFVIEEVFERIIRGEVRATIRSRPLKGIYRIALNRFHPRLTDVYVKILSSREISMEGLAKEHALEVGIEDLGKLKKFLKRLYGEKKLYINYFERV